MDRDLWLKWMPLLFGTKLGTPLSHEVLNASVYLASFEANSLGQRNPIELPASLPRPEAEARHPGHDVLVAAALEEVDGGVDAAAAEHRHAVSVELACMAKKDKDKV